MSGGVMDPGDIGLAVNAGDRQSVITLCGSTRFKRAFQEWNARLTLRGHVVFSVALWGHADKTVDPTSDEKALLDRVHLRKIELSDAIFVLDVGRYVGASTSREIAHAQALGKSVRYLSQEFPEWTEAECHFAGEEAAQLAAHVDRLTSELAKCEESLQVALAREVQLRALCGQQREGLRKARDMAQQGIHDFQEGTFGRNLSDAIFYVVAPFTNVALAREANSECSALVPGDPSTCPREDCEECPVDLKRQLAEMEAERDAAASETKGAEEELEAARADGARLREQLAERDARVAELLAVCRAHESAGVTAGTAMEDLYRRLHAAEDAAAERDAALAAAGEALDGTVCRLQQESWKSMVERALVEGLPPETTIQFTAGSGRHIRLSDLLPAYRVLSAPALSRAIALDRTRRELCAAVQELESSISEISRAMTVAGGIPLEEVYGRYETARHAYYAVLKKLRALEVEPTPEPT